MKKDNAAAMQAKLEEAVRFIEAGDLEKALSSLQTAQQYKTDDGNLSFWLAFVHARTSGFTQALEHIQKAIELQPANAGFLSERGVVYFHLGKKSLAMMDMDKAVELDGSNPYRYSSRAFIRESLGDTEGAVADYEMAIALDPEDAIAHNNLGLLQEKMGYQEKAKKLFEIADKISGVDKSVLMKPSPEPESPRPAEEKPPGMGRIIWNVFTNKKAFLDFVKFWRNRLR